MKINIWNSTFSSLKLKSPVYKNNWSNQKSSKGKKEEGILFIKNLIVVKKSSQPIKMIGWLKAWTTNKFKALMSRITSVMTLKKSFKIVLNCNCATILLDLFKISENKPFKRFRIMIFKGKIWLIAFKLFKINVKNSFIQINP